MNFIKKHWKTILIILLVFLFFSKCSTAGNLERKYKAQVEYTKHAVDSLNNIYSNSAKVIDSLNRVIKISEVEIEALKKQIDIYKEQNDKLSANNKAFANKQVIVNIEKTEENKEVKDEIK